MSIFEIIVRVFVWLFIALAGAFAVMIFTAFIIELISIIKEDDDGRIKRKRH